MRRRSAEASGIGVRGKGPRLISAGVAREFSAMRQGVIDMAIGSTINWSPQVKELNLFSLPFLSQDHAGLDALTQGEVGTRIMQTVEKAGVVTLAWGENGFIRLQRGKQQSCDQCGVLCQGSYPLL